ncbi:hypothetical protein Glove_384g13 [Diversispora epigaea]|uniref:Uncharacterized protein n=1 Tax=Diversispora epigaea TaxID=1348612 RepID=A0A397H3Q3_9GLOM|nr:hypothetical protein Glove_384g13 [Diversispora epigaea]
MEPIEAPLADYIQAKSLPYIGSWIQFSLVIISNLCNNSIEQPQPIVSTHTQEFSKWTIPIPHLNGIYNKLKPKINQYDVSDSNNGLNSVTSFPSVEVNLSNFSNTFGAPGKSRIEPPIKSS